MLARFFLWGWQILLEMATRATNYIGLPKASEILSRARNCGLEPLEARVRELQADLEAEQQRSCAAGSILANEFHMVD